MEYEPVVGLEVHLQLSTDSKIFCSCPTRFGAAPNSQVCPVCLGFPGVLPVLNRKVLEYALKVALALNCKISKVIKFDRKQYFYPDLPKNFQISQYDKPLSTGGFVEIEADGAGKTIGITRAHLEEDAGKLMHDPAGVSLVDYNRCGVPLMEIVSEPDLASPDEAHTYLSHLKAVLEYLEVSTCNMEEGSLRCDANLSLRPKGESRLGTKVEVKNMNTFKGVRSALLFEIVRQRGVLEKGGRVVQETRLWDPDQGETFPMRSKEEAHDYRYFPEPDLVPFTVDETLIESVRRSLPELPQARRKRLMERHELSAYDAGVLVQEKRVADYFEECARLLDRPKLIANWLMGDLAALANARGVTVDGLGLSAERLVDLLGLVDQGTLSTKMARELLPEILGRSEPPSQIARDKGLVQIVDPSALEKVAEDVIRQNPKTAADYLAGKERAIAFLVGQFMQRTQGKANPKLAQEVLKKRLDSLKKEQG